MSTPDQTTSEVRVQAVRYEADGIHSYELRPLSKQPLPPFTAGSHIDLYLGNGMVRSYSLLNAQHETHRYVVSVQRDPSSRGGSVHIHQQIRCGDRMKIGLPRNNFKLHEEAAQSIFIAGGIGITPFVAMAQRMHSLQQDWQLHYFVRAEDKAAFLEQLKSFDDTGERVKLYVNTSPDETGALLKTIIGTAPSTTHFYCCGPGGMIKGFLQIAEGRAVDTVHVEHFSAAAGGPSTVGDGGFKVYLSKLQREVDIPADKSILSTLLDAGIEVPYSCEQGVCGACETRVIEGVPDHRDLVLGDGEKAANKTMMICCSRSKSDRLVLEI